MYLNFLNKINFIRLFMASSFVCALLLLLSGCQQTQRELPSGYAWVTPDTAITIPAAREIPVISVQQLLTAKYADQEHIFITMLNVTDDELNLVGLSTLGIRLFRLNYNAEGIDVEVYAVVKDKIDPEQVLLDIMLSYAPIKAWETTLPQGWYLKDELDGRCLFDAEGKIVMEVLYQTVQGERTPVLLKHKAFQYEIKLELIKE